MGMQYISHEECGGLGQVHANLSIINLLSAHQISSWNDGRMGMEGPAVSYSGMPVAFSGNKGENLGIEVIAFHTAREQ
jgi:hypothetical protein